MVLKNFQYVLELNNHELYNLKCMFKYAKSKLAVSEINKVVSIINFDESTITWNNSKLEELDLFLSSIQNDCPLTNEQVELWTKLSRIDRSIKSIINRLELGAGGDTYDS